MADRVNQRPSRHSISMPVWLPGLALLLALTLPHIAQGDFRTDTAWYAAIGVQSWRAESWLDFWSPEAEPGFPYFNKPPLALWIHGFLLHALGIQLWVARIGSVLAAVVALLCSVQIARLTYSRLGAAVSGCVLATTYEFFRRTKEISLDLWHTAFLFAALWCMVSVAVRAISPDSAAAVRRNWLWCVWWCAGGACVGLALMCKPLQGLLVFPIVGLWGVVALPRASRRVFAAGLVLAVLAALAVALPWHVSMAAIHGGAFADRYFGGEIGERLKAAMDGGAMAQFDVEPQHWTFYLRQIVSTYWPWLVAVIGAVRLMVVERRREKREVFSKARAVMGLALIWIVIWLVALTIFPDRRDRYALVLWPALALVAAAVVETEWFVNDRGGRTREGVARAVRIVPWFAAVAGVVFAIAPVRVQRGVDPQWPVLFESLRSEEVRDETIYAGGIHGNMSARLYLEFGWWPRVVDDASPPERGTLLLYHKRGVRSPGPGEATVLRERDLWMTRLEGTEWRPTEGNAAWE